MARRKKAAAELLGAEEFAGSDTERDAIEKIAAARQADAAEAKDNGGPILDAAAWRRASNELVAEQIEIDRLMEKVAEVRGRISSIKKVAEKCNVDWDVVKLYAKYARRIRVGEMGEVVTEHRRLAQLMRIMDCPLHTQFGLFPDLEEQATPVRPGMDAELQGQAAYRNSEPAENNPFQAGSEEFALWDQGWRNAMRATAHEMAH